MLGTECFERDTVLEERILNVSLAFPSPWVGGGVFLVMSVSVICAVAVW